MVVWPVSHGNKSGQKLLRVADGAVWSRDYLERYPLLPSEWKGLGKRTTPIGEAAVLSQHSHVSVKGTFVENPETL